MLIAPQAEKGDNILAKFRELVRYVEAGRLMPGPGVRIYHSARGQIVSYDAKVAAWPHPWKVWLPGGRSVRMLPGFCNNTMPKIDGIFLNGRKPGTTEVVAPPELKLTQRANRDLVSWVALQVIVDEKVDSALEKDSTIVHCRSLNPADDGLDPELTAREPLAILYHREDGIQVSHVGQIAMLNLKYRHRSTGDGSRRHFFFS